jgi:hypothetical protein
MTPLYPADDAKMGGPASKMPPLPLKCFLVRSNSTPVHSSLRHAGNPTGQCLSEANMKEVLTFCHAEGLVLMADEVGYALPLSFSLFLFLPFSLFSLPFHR